MVRATFISPNKHEKEYFHEKIPPLVFIFSSSKNQEPR